MNEPLFDKMTHYSNTTDSANPHSRRNGGKSKPLPLSELVVDGLLQGMAAGMVMLLVFLTLGAFEGHEAELILAALGLTPGATATQGMLVHFAISAAYGVLWSILIVLPLRLCFPATTASTWGVVGVAFGCITWLIAEIALIASTGLSLLPWFALLIAHLLYGGTLGCTQARRLAQKGG